MGTLLVLALLCHSHLIPVASVSGNMVWEQRPIEQKTKDYHPKLRYYSGSRFMFETPYYITEGRYSMDGSHYSFTPETAIELNRADVNKLLAELDLETRREKEDNYNKSLVPFDANYDAGSGTLTLNYVVNGVAKRYSLFKYTDGDESLTPLISDDERSVVGLWYMPDPFPEKLDSKTRYRIEAIDGLKKFSKEASASDRSQFALLDIKVDRSYRIDGNVSRWRKEGSKLILITEEGKEVEFTITKDYKLVRGGSVAFVRN